MSIEGISARSSVQPLFAGLEACPFPVNVVFARATGAIAADGDVWLLALELGNRISSCRPQKGAP